MSLIQAVALFLLPLTTAVVVFAALARVVLPCYGGGFGTMPAFATDYCGAKHVGASYGLMLTAGGSAACWARG